ncbi:hypothetical protein [Polaromonas sp. UC242_47]|uniref:hypothetical protein n=1 Tax=Polaromonas sp. UC242_47 TaxID=3374626 RepID=UPI0037A7AE37
MATKKVPAIVTPAEWKERTSLRLSSRGDTTLELDAAYTRWYNSRRQPNERIEEMYRKELQDKLQQYVSEHGGSWKKSERNKVSNGLLEFIYGQVHKPDPITERGRNRIAEDNVHSRYGVLYLLGNIDINMDYMGITLEGVGAVGGALASGLGTNYDKLKDVDKVDKVAFKVGKEEVSVSDAFGYASKVGLPIIGKAGEAIMAPGAPPVPARRRGVVMGPGQLGFIGGKPVLGPAPFQDTRNGKGLPHAVANMNYLQLTPRPLSATPTSAQSDGGFPLTKRALAAMGRNKVAAIAFAPVSGAVVVGAFFYDLMRKVIDVLVSLVSSFVDWLKDKLLQDSEFPFTAGAGLIKGLVMFTVKKCAAAAVPFVSAGLDLLTGLAQSFKAIKMKVGGWLERRKIRITEGHPALLASRIERCMTMDIASGLWTMVKGAVQMALAATVPGAQSLVSAIATAVEWVIKFVMRLIEQASIKLFLLQARVQYMLARKLTKKDDSGHRVVDTQNAAKSKTSLIHDLDAFKKFYQSGCNASPIIAMLTLNTGICGSQWQLQNMFTDIGEIGQKEFDSGTQYFTRLKRYGKKYLGDSGFEFNANPIVGSDKKYIQGLLDHAKNHHAESTKKTVGSVFNGVVSAIAT